MSAATSGEGIEKTARLLSDRMRGNRLPAGKQEVLISSVEKNFPMRVVKHWNRGPEKLWATHTSPDRVLSDLS